MVYFPKKSFLLSIFDSFLFFLAFYFAHIVRGIEANFSDLFWLQFVIIATIFLMVFYILDFYNLKQNFLCLTFFLKFLGGCFISFVILSMFFYFVPNIKTGRSILIITTFYVSVFSFLNRAFFEKFILKFIFKKKKIAIVAPQKEVDFLYEALRDKKHIEIRSIIDDSKCINYYTSPIFIRTCDEIYNENFINDIDKVVISIKTAMPLDILMCLLNFKSRNIDVVDLPSFYEEIYGKIPLKFINLNWLILNQLHGLRKTIYTTKIKNILDYSFAFIGLVLALPILLFSMFLIILDDGFPVIFKQERVGKDGKIFNSYKLRTMKVGFERKRDKAGSPDDPRITRVGKFLRKFRIDEIPQLWNVLKGDISFVGPRALIPEEVEYFKRNIDFFDFRHAVKPGITGWAQVNYRHGVTLEDGLEKFQYDLFYIKNMSPTLDIYIILKTIKVVLTGFGGK